MLILGIDTCGRQGSVALLQAPDEGAGRPAAHRRTCAPQRRPILRAAGPRHRRAAGAPRRARSARSRSSPSPAAPVRSPDCASPLLPSRDWPRPSPSRSSPSPCWRRSCSARAAEGRAVAAIDAQRGEVFFGEFAAVQSARRDCHAVAAFTAALAARLDSAAKVFTPDEALAARLRDAAVRSSCDSLESAVARPSAEDIARIAYRKFLDGVRADVATLDANYVRRSDAELFSAPKLGIIPDPR